MERSDVNILTAARSTAIALVTGALVLMTPSPSFAAVGTQPLPSWQTNGTVHTVLYTGGRVYLGGDFTQLRSSDGSQVVTRNRIAAIDLASGGVVAGFNPDANMRVSALATDGTSIFAGGAFTTIGGLGGRHRLAALDPATGQARAGWAVGGKVEALAVGGSRLYVGGTFTVFEGVGRQYLAAVDIASGALDTGWTPSPDARVRALDYADGAVFAGGDFLAVDGAAHRRISRLHPTNGSAAGFTGSAGGAVWGLSAVGSRVYLAIGGAGGACSALNAATGRLHWEVATNGNSHGIALIDGTVYCGGHFGGSASFGGETRYKLAAVNDATGRVDPFAPRVNSATGVLALDTDGTHLFAGGAFTRVTRLYQQGVAIFE